MYVQLVALFQIEDFDKKSSDKIGTLYFILGMMNNVAIAAAFGKPYTPAYFSIEGLILLLIIGGIWRGLWDWCGLFSLLLQQHSALVYNIFGMVIGMVTHPNQ
jgi:hypothetical protein